MSRSRVTHSLTNDADANADETLPLLRAEHTTVSVQCEETITLRKGQGAALKRATAALTCAGFFAGMVFLLLVQSLVKPNDNNDEPEPASLELALPEPNASSNCTSTVDVSELMQMAFVDTFFNASCIAAGATGDPCDVHMAHEYTHRSFAALRVDSLIAEVLSLMASFSLFQVGGIPRATDANGALFLLAWMSTQFAQWILTLVAICFEVRVGPRGTPLLPSSTTKTS